MSITYSRDFVEKTLRDIQARPTAFSDEFSQTILDHAEFYTSGEMPERLDTGFSARRTIAAAGSGFFTGASTLRTDFEPHNSAEAIAYSIGNVMGFGGMFPAFGKGKFAGGLRALRGKSVPLWAADKIMKGVGSKFGMAQAGKAAAAGAARNFMLSPKLLDVAEGATRLGLASAVSSWQGGPGEMATGFKHGAMLGGAYKGIANIPFFSRGGIPTIKRNAAGKIPLTGAQKQDKVFKALFGSTVTGIPATVTGRPVPEQVYEYILGAWFGANEVSVTGKNRNKFLGEFLTGNKKYEGPRIDVTKAEGFDKLAPEVQKGVMDEVAGWYGVTLDHTGTFRFMDVLKNKINNLETDIDILTKAGVTSEEALREAETEAEAMRATREESNEKALKDFTLHSGGADTADTLWEQYAGDAGIGVVSHSFQGHASHGVGKNRVVHTPAELAVAEPHVRKAMKNVGMSLDNYGTDYVRNLFVRNYYEVADSDGVFATTRIGKDGNVVKGGTAVTIELAKQRGMNNIHVFDMETNTWNRWDVEHKMWTIEDTPILTKRSTGIGVHKSEEMTGAGQEAVYNVVNKTQDAMGLLTLKQAADALEAPNRGNVQGRPEKPVSDASGILKRPVDRLAEQPASESLNDATAQMADGDMGAIPENNVSGRWSKYVTRRHMEGVDPLKANEVGFEIDRLLNEQVRTLREAKDTYVDETAIVERLETASDKPVGDELRGAIRLKLIRESQGVKHIRLTYNIDQHKLVYSKLLEYEGPKEIMDVYTEVTGKPGEHGIRIIDGLERKNSRTGRNETITLQRYEGDTAGYGSPLNSIRQAMAKEGYIYFGGRSDKGRFYFIKEHPKAETLKNATIRKKLKQAIELSGESTNDLRALREDYVKEVVKMAPEGAPKEKLTEIRRDARELFDREAYNLLLWKQGLAGDMETIDFLKNVVGLQEGNWVKSLKDENKRDGINHNTGYKQSSRHTREHVEDAPDGRFNYLLTRDLDSLPPKIRDMIRAASTMLQGSDGEILTRTDVVDALNSFIGLGWANSSVNKSFIVDRTPDRNGKKFGTLLGKFKFSDAGELSEWMFKHNIHMIIPESAAKQYGLRNLYDIPIGSNGLWADKAPPRELVYSMPSEAVHQIYGVKTTPHNMENVALAKQMLTVLTQYGKGRVYDNNGKDITESVLEDISTTSMLRGIGGNPETTAKFKKWFEGDMKVEDLVKITERDSEVELGEVVSAANSNNNQVAAVMLRSLLKKLRNSIVKDHEEGATSPEQAANMLRNLDEMVNVSERIMDNSEATNLVSIYHKDIRTWRNLALRSYVTDRILRPEMPNSLSGMMKGYDIGLQKLHPDLEFNENLFYLGNNFKEKMMDVSELTGFNRKFVKLGKLWELSKTEKDPRLKAELEEFLTGMAVRVPLSAAGGVRIVKFGGFTGRRGYDILLHGNAMEAMDGADLDGDKANIYFGTKKSWRDFYDANKAEFAGKGGVPTDPKQAIAPKGFGEFSGQSMQDLLTFTNSPSKRDALMRLPLARYSPFHRSLMSFNAAAGRDNLGAHMTTRQSELMMFNSRRSLLEKGDFVDKNGEVIKGRDPSIVVEGFGGKDVRFEPRDPSELEFSRLLSRAGVAFPSDPMNESGLRAPDVFSGLYFYSMFKPVEKVDINTKNIGELGKALKKNHVYQNFRDINKFMYGRNYYRNRQWGPDEVYSGLTSAVEGTREGSQSAMQKAAEHFLKYDLSSNIFHHADPVRLFSTYKLYNDLIASRDDIKNIVGNTKLQIGDMSSQFPTAELVKFIYRNRLYDRDVRHAHVESGEKFADLWYEHKKNTVMETRDGTRMKLKDFPQAELDFKMAYQRSSKKPKRLADVDQFIEKAEALVLNDMTHMASVLHIRRPLDELAPEVAKPVVRAGYYFKEKYSRGVEEASSSADIVTAAAVWGEEFSGNMRSRDQVRYEIDLEIDAYKKSLGTEAERDLLDAVLLSPFVHNEAASKLQGLYGTLAARQVPGDQKGIGQLFKDGAKTAHSRMGLQLQSVSDKSVAEHLRRLDELFNASIPERTAKEKKETPRSFEERIIADMDEPMDFVTVAGFPSEKELKDFSLTRPRVDLNASSLEKITSVMTPEHGATLTKFQSIIERLPDKALQDLDSITRGISQKDWADMNLHDIENFNRKMESINNAEPKGLSYWYHYMFPGRVADRMMTWAGDFESREGWYLKDGKFVKGHVSIPISVGHKIQTQTDHMYQWAEAAANKDKAELHDKLFFLSNEGVDGEGVFRVATTQMELGVKPGDGIGFPGEAHRARETYQKRYAKAVSETDYNKWSDKTFHLTWTDGTVKEVTGKELVSMTQKIVVDYLHQFPELIRGDRGFLMDYVNSDKPELEHKVTYTEPSGQSRTKTLRTHNIDVDKLNAAMEKRALENLGPPKELGVNGFRIATLNMQLKMLEKYNINDPQLVQSIFYELEKLWEPIERGFPTRPKESFYPHILVDRAESTRAMKEIFSEIKAREQEIGIEKTQELINKLVMSHMFDIGSQDVYAPGEWEAFDQAKALKAQGKLKPRPDDGLGWLNMPTHSFGSMKGRTGHVPGWDYSIRGLESYTDSFHRTFQRQAAELLSRHALEKFETDATAKWGKKHKEHIKNWKNFWGLYANDALGYPAVIPERLLKNPGMKLKGTLYSGTADNHVRNRVQKIKEKLGLAGHTEIERALKKVDYSTLARWSNLEARYSLITLLAHPKSSMANLYGGTLNTMIMHGFRTLRKARDIKYLRSNVNGEWESMEDVYRYVMNTGVLPDFIISEMELSPHKSKGAYAKFFRSSKDFLKSPEAQGLNPKELSSRLLGLAKQNNVTEGMFNVAASFMRIPELMLRRDAFITGLIAGHESFGGNIPYNDPILIELAKKTVKASQFMYNAPHRPAFARTSLGKVLSRFQLWSWNSVKFRNNLFKDAQLYGFEPGEQMERLKRMAVADLLALGLANAFAYSLFEASLPAPYNWFQDTALWLFGDEEERNRAFFGKWGAVHTGLSPLQIVTPPIMRLGPDMLGGLITGEWNTMADYTLWTMAPFGRIARDLVGKGNIIENPIRIPEKALGIPLSAMQRASQKRQRAKEKAEEEELEE